MLVVELVRHPPTITVGHLNSKAIPNARAPVGLDWWATITSD